MIRTHEAQSPVPFVDLATPGLYLRISIRKTGFSFWLCIRTKFSPAISFYNGKTRSTTNSTPRFPPI